MLKLSPKSRNYPLDTDLEDKNHRVFSFSPSDPILFPVFIQNTVTVMEFLFNVLQFYVFSFNVLLQRLQVSNVC